MADIPPSGGGYSATGASTTGCCAWVGDAGRRLVHAPRLHLTDAGLAARLSGADAARLDQDRDRLGPLLETFVVGELRRQAGWAEHGVRRSHHRSHDGRGVDVVLEDRSGSLVGIEVKAARSIGLNDLRGLHAFAERMGDRFVRGVVLYTGTQVIPFRADLHAVPISALWRTA